MQSLSVLFLLVTFWILLRVRKRVRGERIAIQINLVVSLTLYHTVTLLHDAAMTNPTACRAIAVLTHFFLLSSGEKEHTLANDFILILSLNTINIFYFLKWNGIIRQNLK